jgi:DNA-binding LytR/AlgR family response regulator
MIKILIVEDQVLIADHIKNILNENQYTQLEIAYKINQAIEKVESFKPDVVLLDINVEGRDTGIEWAKQHVKEAKIIFITGQSELSTLQKALEVNPVSYLTKPIRTIDLLAALKLVSINNKPNHIIIKDGYNEVKLNMDQILFVKSDKNYIDIQTQEKKYTVRNTLDNFYKDLDITVFCKIHRSYIVNASKIVQKKTNSVIIDKYELPLSRGCDLNF